MIFLPVHDFAVPALVASQQISEPLTTMETPCQNDVVSSAPIHTEAKRQDNTGVKYEAMASTVILP